MAQHLLRRARPAIYRYLEFLKVISVFCIALCIQTGTFANPLGGIVESGSATISQSVNNTVIQQNSQQAIISWQSFNVGSQEKVAFQQPTNGIALNRIDPNQGASQIYGQVTATGKIILINQAGIYFGPGSHVDVGGIMASTTDMSNANFLAGKYIFDRPSTYNASVVNAGSITTADYGLAALMGTGVVNSGVIQARLGNVVLASGNKFTVSLSGDNLINFTVDEAANHAGTSEGKALKDGVSNTGSIIADGGTVLMTARAAAGVVDNAINMGGIVQARSVSQHNGEIILAGGTGKVRITGHANVASKQNNVKGGKIKVSGENIDLTSTAVLDASGENGGGEILVGGDIQGTGILPHALQVRVDAGANLLADAYTHGDGGKIVVWSDGTTSFHGAIHATGGSVDGNGGFAETSGHVLDIAGAKINLSAPLGAMGTWLLDPTDVTISNSATSNDSYASGTYTPSTNTSNILASELLSNLANTNVNVLTASGGAGTGNITLSTDLSWNSASTLTLTAAGKIYLNGNITATNGGLVLNAVNSAQSITSGSAASPSSTGVTANINVANFNLTQGQWYQVNSTLPTFNVSNNFQLNSGNGQSATVQFLRSTGGNGSTITPYVLTDIYGLQGIGSNSTMLGYSYSLGNDIDATKTLNWNSSNLVKGFVPIGDSTGYFLGVFDGQNHTINNLYINNSSPTVTSIGLFGYIYNATIKNVGLTNANITNTGSGYFNVGTLVGVKDGLSSLLDNSYATGTLTYGNSTYTSTGGYAGGLIGTNQSGNITNSYSTVTITLTAPTSLSSWGIYSGGFAGYNNGSISTSYSAGTIQGAIIGGMYQGGFIANNTSGIITNTYSLTSVLTTGSGMNGGFVAMANFGAISNSYSTGAVVNASGGTGGFVGSFVGGTITNSFWDTGTSSQTAGSATAGTFTGNSGANLSSMNTYVSAGWDVSASSGHTWYMVDGSTRPLLQMERNTTIQNAHQLQLMGLVPNANYTLANNLDLNTTAADVWGANHSFVPIGNNTTPFTGGFNGQNYTISNLIINTPANNYVGLFGKVNTSGAIQNVSLANVTVSGGSYTGALIGYLAAGTVTSSYSSGTVAGAANSNAVGGLIGFANGNVNTVYNYGSVISGNGSTNTGGLIGYLDTSGSLSTAFSAGALSGSGLGGLVGGNAISNTSNVTNSYWDTTLSGVNSSAGGTAATSLQMAQQSTFTGWDFTNTFNIANYPYFKSAGNTVSLSGTALLAATPLANNSTIGIANNGSTIDLIIGDNGSFSTGPFAPNYLNNTLLLYLTSGGTQASVASIVPSNGALGNINFVANTIGVGSTVTGTLSAMGLSNAIGSLNLSNALYTASGGNLTLNNGINLASTNTTTFTANASITATGSGSVVFNGPLTLATSNALTASSGTLTFNAAVTLEAPNITLTTNNSAITFNSTVNKPQALTLAAGTGTVSFNSTVGATSALASLTSLGSGNINFSGNVSTVGNQTYGGQVGISSNSSLATSSAGNITLTSGAAWSGALSLTLNAGTTSGKIYLNGNITAPLGYLNLFASNTSQSITGGTSATPSAAGVTANVTVANFNITKGQWYQVNSTLPTFTVANNFQLNTGTMPNTVAQFLRATGGDGSTGNPYVLTDIYGLQGVGSNTTTLGYSYNLGNNIDATSTINWNSANTRKGFIPLGNSTASTNYKGTFNGQNYAINGLYINTSTTGDVGLFGNISTTAVIQNIGITNANITITGAPSNGVGTLVGVSNGSSVITNAYSTGTITVNNGSSSTRIGGLVGVINGSLTNSYTTTNIVLTKTGTSSFINLGGLVGWLNTGSISNSYAAGSISGTLGTITSADIGGFIGANYRPISDSYSSTSINVTGTASGDGIGGFVGGNSGGSITRVYSSGSIVGGTGNVGGFAGNNNSTGSITNSFWDTGTSGKSTGIVANAGTVTNVTGGTFTGSAGANLTSMSTYTSAPYSWDVSSSSGHTWYMIDGSTRPFLQMEYTTAIKNAHQLELVNLAPSASYTVAANIDMSNVQTAADIWGTTAGSGLGFIPIGNNTTPFSGSFNGQSYNISNLYIKAPSNSYIGLFGKVNTSGTIQNTYLINASVSGASYTGSLVGYLAAGTVTSSYSTGSVTGAASSNAVGGLIGYSNGSVDNAYTYANVTIGASATNAGGLIGYLDTNSLLNTSYSSNVLTGSGFGGLVGGNAVGGASNVTNSYWDKSISSINTSSGGTGKTTAEMGQQATFSGWDFTNIFNMANYPYLKLSGNALSGTALLSNVALANTTISAATNGNVFTFTTAADGTFTNAFAPNYLNNNTPVLLYLTGATAANIALLAPSTGSLSTLNFVANTLGVGTTATATLSTQNLSTSVGNLVSSNILYAVAGGNLTLNSDISLATTNTTTFNLGGSVTASGAGTLTFNGPLSLTAGSTLTTNNSATTLSTVNGAQTLAIAAGSGTVTFGSAVGGTTALSSLTSSGSGNVILNSNVTTTGDQTYSGALAINNNTTLTTTSAGNITLGNGVSWSGALSLGLTSAAKIYLNGNITAASGTLNLSAANSSQSITGGTAGAPSAAGVAANISVANFNLTQGQWYQVNASLPTFSVSNNFQLNSGNIPVSTVQFVRATSGNGSSGSAYTITDAYGLQGIGSNSTTLAAYWKLGSNIDLTSSANWNSGTGFKPIGNSTTKFSGNFNGQNYIISNLYINNPTADNLGLFGYLSNGTITNLGLTGSVNGHSYIGLLIGAETGSGAGNVLSNVFVTGLITGNSGASNNEVNVGGLAGQFQFAAVSNVSANVTINANSSNSTVGGLVGNMTSSTLTNAYSAGSVANSASGQTAYGLIATNGGSNTVTASYWDTQSSGRSSSALGTGLTTAQMMQSANFSGWDFTNTWNIMAGTSYPYLKAFYSATPQVISGTTTSVPTGSKVVFAANGIVLGQTYTGANGAFYLLQPNNTFADGANIVTYLSSGSTFSNNLAVISGNNASLTGLSLAANTIQVHSNISAINNTTLATMLGSINSTDILYSVSGANLTLGNATNKNATLATTSSTTYTVDGTISTIAGGSSSINFAGPVTINTNSITTTGNQTYSGAVTSNSNLVLTAGAGAISIANSGNNLSGTLGFSNTGANNVSIYNTAPLQLIASSTGGNLTATSTGAITQTGALTVSGTSSFTAGANTIILTNASNLFTGAVSLSNSGANDVAFTNNQALTLGTVNIGSGNFSVTTSGSLTQSGIITQAASAGTVTFTQNTAASDILLNTQANSFTGSMVFAGTLSNIRDLGLRNTSASATLPTNLSSLTSLRNLTLQLNSAAIALPTLTLTNSGNLSVTAGGAITQTGAVTVPGTSSFTAGANAITLTNASNLFTGAVSLSNSGANDVAFTNNQALTLGTVNIGSGNFSVTASGSITQNGVITQAASAGTVTFTQNTTASDILLNTQANSFTGSIVFAGTLDNIRDFGLRNISANATLPTNLSSLTSLRNLTLQLNSAAIALPTLTLTNSGNLSVTAGGAITQTGVVTVPGTSSFTAGANAITLTNASNLFTGAVSLSNSGANNVALVNNGALVLGTVGIGTGTFGITANGSISQSGAITQASSAGAVTLTQNAASSDILLNTQANNFSGSITYGGTLGNIRDVGFRNTNASATLPTNLSSLTNLRNLTLQLNSAAIALPTLTLTNSGNLSVTAGGAITQTGVVTVPGTSSFTAGANAITLTNASNAFTGAISLSNSTATASVTNSLATVLGLSNVPNLVVISAGAITQTGLLTVSGTSNFTAGANAITLTNASNAFWGAVSLSNSGTNDVSLTNNRALVVGTMGVGTGNFNVTVRGAITQTGAITQAASAGTVTFTQTTAVSDILLNTQANSFTGPMVFAGTLSNIRDFSLRNTSASATLPTNLSSLTSLRNLTLQFDNAAIALPALTLTNSGNLSATAGGAITQTGAVTVPGTSSFNAGANAITLTNTSNLFTGAVSLSNSGANDVSLINNRALVVGTTNVGTGNFSLTSSGSMTQSGAITQAASAGTVTFAQNTTASDILLNTQANSFTGSMVFAGTMSNIRDFSLRNTSASATLPTNFSSLTNLRNVTLLLNSAAIALPTLTLTNSGNLSVTAGGAITQTGAVTVPGTSSFTAGANAITLTNASNVFTGAVTLSNSGANNVALVNNSALVLGTVGIGTGTFGITANGSISQSGAITQAASAGAVTLTQNAASSDILLNTQANNFSGSITYGGTLGNIRDVGLRNTNASATLPTNLSSLTNLRNLTLTFNSASMTLPALTVGGNITLTAGTSIVFNGAIAATAGTLTLTAANSAQSITTGASGSINVANFNLLQGQWYQVSASLPAFTVSNNFQINTGTLPATTAQFLRATGGSGSAISPYVITDVYGLQGMGSTSTMLGYSYSLGNNIDATNTVNWNSANTRKGFVPVGSTTTNYSGTFDGQNYAINGLYINTSTTADVGLFANLSGTVKNVGVTNVNITASGAPTNGVGALVGSSSSASSITNAYSTGTISIVGANTRIGGLVGQLTGSLNNAYSTVAINLTQTGTSSFINLGGLVGWGQGSAGKNITNSYAAGSISGSVGTITNADIGGFIGANQKIISDSYSLTTINLTGTTTGDGVGGFAGGNNGGTITRAYSAGAVSGGTGNIAGFAGSNNNSGTISYSFWDTATSGKSSGFISNTATITNLTSGTFNGSSGANLSSQNTFSSAPYSWDFSSTWGIITGTSYPYLKAFYSTAPRIITGTAYSDAGSTALTGGKAINLVVNGNNLATAYTGADGNFYFLTGNNAISNSGSITDNANVLLYLNGGTVKGNTISVVPNAGGSLSGLTLRANTIQVDSNVTALTNTALGTIKGAINSTDILYSVSGANLTLGNATNKNATLSTTSSTTYTVDGTISTVATGSSSVNFAGPVTINASSITTAGNQTYSGAVTSNTNLVLTAGAGAISIANSGNNLSGTLGFSNTGANNVSIYNAAPLQLIASSTGGNLTATSTGAITQTGALTVSGTSNFTAGANAITLTQANAFTGAITLNNSGANDVSVTNNLSTTLATSSIGRNLTITSSGAITESGALTVGGTANFTAGANAITLTQANAFTGAISLNNSGANDVSVTNNLSTTLATSSIGRNLTITSSGAITESGALTVGGTANFTAGANAITLTQANAFTGAVSLNNSGASDVSVTNTLATALNASNIGGNLTITSSGAITESGALTVGGTANFTAGANAITLTHANAFTGAISLNNSGANDVSVTNNLSTALAASSIGRNLTITSSGAITESGALTVGGTANFTAGANAITLTQANAFTGAVSLNNSGANNVALTNAGALILGTVNVGIGALAITASGQLTQNGALTQAAGAGAVTITENTLGSDIVLNTQANNISGAVTFAGALNNIRDISLRNINANAALPTNLTDLNNLRNLTLQFDNAALTLPALTLNNGGNLAVAAGGAITQSGALTIPGTSHFNANNYAINLANTNNQFADAVSLNNTGNNNVNLSGKTALVLGAATVGGNLILNINGTLLINDAISVPNGLFEITAANTPNSITTTANGSLNVANFNLAQGQWYQNSPSLPAFSVTHNFQINSGSLPNAGAQFIRVSGGNGSNSHPYAVGDIYGLQGMASSAATLASSFNLTNNIDGTITQNWNNGKKFITIGTSALPYSGIFNAQGFVVSNLSQWMLKAPEHNSLSAANVLGYIAQYPVINNSINTPVLPGNSYVYSMPVKNNLILLGPTSTQIITIPISISPEREASVLILSNNMTSVIISTSITLKTPAAAVSFVTFPKLFRQLIKLEPVTFQKPRVDSAGLVDPFLSSSLANSITNQL